MKVLYIDVCISTNKPSRTRRLCEAYLDTCRQKGYEIQTLNLEELDLQPYNEALLEARNTLLEVGDYDDSMFDVAKACKDADRIVVGAPYWDLSFPSMLKILVEHLMVSGLTFRYTDTGAEGLCKADKLVYITSAGGYIEGQNYGYDYMKAVASMFGIKDAELISAQGLDIVGNDVESIMQEALEKIYKEN